MGRIDDGFPCARLKETLDAWDALRACAAKRGLSLGPVLLAALNTVLASWALARRPFRTVVAVAARQTVAADASSAIGDFTALSWVTENLKPGSLARRAADTARTIASDLAHGRASPIEALQQPRRTTVGEDDGHTVVFTDCLSDEPVQMPHGVVWGYGVSSTPGVDLDCYVYNVDGRLGIHWDYRRASIDSDAAAQMFAEYAHLVRRLADDDGVWDVTGPRARSSVSGGWSEVL
jgi:non-ribosomal peptide synthetase component F